MPLDVVVGLQRGDEGKGRFVDLVAKDYKVIARGNGGANAGHTVIPDNLEPLALHQIPSGITYPDKLNIIGNGVYLDPLRLQAELENVRATGIKVDPSNLLISDSSHLVFPHHVILDALREGGDQAQGSTKSGIAYVAADKFLREGLRVEMIEQPKLLSDHARQGLAQLNGSLPKEQQLSLNDIKAKVDDWMEAVEGLRPYVADTVEVINQRLDAGEAVLAEGAQAYWLDINHGMYPAVTSSSTTVIGLLDGLGVSPKHLNKTTGVAKSVKSHVGGGPFVTEIHEEALASQIRGEYGKADSEFGATTKRPRRIGYPDIVELRNAARLNGVDEIALSKLDHVPRYGKVIKVATSYNYQGDVRLTAPSSALALEKCSANYINLPSWDGDISNIHEYSELPKAAIDFVGLFERELGLPVTKIGVGPGRSQVILRR
ncbi:MAG TPA: adenylosuccinate synthetase [Candidatus Saccharimonadales bacterium]|nr:adenylosuccinate synthetase [Candidatus Saccharimonadales bacterium]